MVKGLPRKREYFYLLRDIEINGRAINKIRNIYLCKNKKQQMFI